MIVPFAAAPKHAEHLDPVLALLPHRPKRESPDDVALVPSYGELVKARRQKFSRIVLAQHGAGQSYGGDRSKPKAAFNPGYPGGRDNHDVGLFLAPNEHAAKRWRDAYPKASVAIVGCPKLDTLPAREPGPGPVVAVSFHWDAHMCPEAGSAFRHFARGIGALAESYQVLGHGHPQRHDLPHFWRDRGIEYVKDFAEVCRRADVYVCDNSSTIFEFASTGRPVIVLDSPTYRRHVHHGLRFWEAADVGIHCSEAGGLTEAVTEALADRHPEQRETALDIVYAVRHGAAQRAADAITEWA